MSESDCTLDNGKNRVWRTGIRILVGSDAGKPPVERTVFFRLEPRVLELKGISDKHRNEIILQLVFENYGRI